MSVKSVIAGAATTLVVGSAIALQAMRAAPPSRRARLPHGAERPSPSLSWTPTNEEKACRHGFDVCSQLQFDGCMAAAARFPGYAACVATAEGCPTIMDVCNPRGERHEATK